MLFALAKRSTPSVDRPAGDNTLPEWKLIFSSPLRIAAVWFARSAERRELRHLAKDRRLLSDIGITREQMIDEAVKPFWRR